MRKRGSVERKLRKFSKEMQAELRKDFSLLPFVTMERSVTELLRRGRQDIKISSADLDPAFLPAECADSAGEPSPETYDGGNVISSRAGNSDGSDISGIAWACDAMGQDGFAVFKVRGWDPRKSTPDWVFRQELLIEFIKSRISPSDLAAKRIPLKARIDYVILSAFFLEVFTDEEIFDLGVETTTGVFEPMSRLLRQDKSGSRFTNSVKALAARRERLVKAGNEYFHVADETADEDETDDCNITLALTNFRQDDINITVSRTKDVDDWGLIPKISSTSCVIYGCPNKIQTPSPMIGLYICPQHPLATAAKINNERSKGHKRLEIQNHKLKAKRIASLHRKLAGSHGTIDPLIEAEILELIQTR